ncbi:MAG: UDP-N-acetylmuramate dehydrogenase [Candidatus Omnitrophota bacterium]
MKQDLRNTLLNISGIQVAENVPLREMTTFRVGGPASLLITCSRTHAFREVLAVLRDHKQEVRVIGEGSNILAADRGLDAVVVRYLSRDPEISRQKDVLRVSGSALLDDVALYASEYGLVGLSFASGIPGTVAGAVVGNAGAFGRQMSDIVQSVEIVDDQGAARTVSAGEIAWAYRKTDIENKRWLVTAVRFVLESGSHASLVEDRREILALRSKKHPDYQNKPCAGSFFKNIVHTDGSRQAAGWFLEQAGCLGMRVGGAAVYDRHANIIVNEGQAAAADIVRLADIMRDAVRTSFGIDLEPEVRYWGFQG